MNSRMEKYTEQEKVTSTRTSKNRKLYEEVSTINVDYIDFDSVQSDSNVLEIPFTKSDTAVKTREDYHKLKELSEVISVNEDKPSYIETEKTENRIYDINEILKKAKEELKVDENKKRLINTEYNILTKLDIDKFSDEQELKKEELKEIIENVYPKKEKVDNEEDLFEDLKGSDLNKEILEKETGDIKLKDTSEVKVTLEDNNIDTVETEIIKMQKKSSVTLIFIIIVVVLLLVVLAYLLLKYFKVI